MNQDPKKLLERFQPRQVKMLTPDQQMCIVRYSPCGKVLAASGFDGKVRRWDASSDQLPPRMTLYRPFSGPVGFLSGLTL